MYSLDLEVDGRDLPSTRWFRGQGFRLTDDGQFVARPGDTEPTEPPPTQTRAQEVLGSDEEVETELGYIMTLDKHREKCEQIRIMLGSFLLKMGSLSPQFQAKFGEKCESCITQATLLMSQIETIFDRDVKKAHIQNINVGMRAMETRLELVIACANAHDLINMPLTGSSGNFDLPSNPEVPPADAQQPRFTQAEKRGTEEQPKAKEEPRFTQAEKRGSPNKRYTLEQWDYEEDEIKNGLDNLFGGISPQPDGPADTPPARRRRLSGKSRPGL